jgi:hypothetical protein
VFGDQSQQLAVAPSECATAIYHNDPCAQTFLCRSVKQQFAQVHRWDRLPAIDEQASHALGSLREFLQCEQRHNLDHMAGFQRVPVIAKLEKHKEHGIESKSRDHLPKVLIALLS